MWFSDLDKNEFLAIWRQRIYKSWLNYSEMEGS